MDNRIVELIDAVREILDNRSVDYLHRDDREMLKEALLPVEEMMPKELESADRVNELLRS